MNNSSLPLAAPLVDSFGRHFSYLRLSITDVCNFRCSYSLPDGYVKNDQAFLAAGFAEIGISKIRLTGGEPTVRKDFLDIATRISRIPGIKKLALTTNGYSLKKHAQGFFDAGITAVNISIDSLNDKRFKEITDHDKLPLILEGVDEAIRVGIKSIKINTVILRDLNDGELDDFMNFVKDKPISLRFIELMQTGDNLEYFGKHHLKSDFIQTRLLNKGWKAEQRKIDAGPAIEYYHPDSLKTIRIVTQ